MTDPGTGDAVGFVMPHAPGETAESVLDRRGTADWTVREKIEIAAAVARAVAAVHAVTAPTVILGDVLKGGNLVVDGVRVTFVDAATVSLLGYRGADGSRTDTVPGLSTPGYVPKEDLDHPDAVPSHTADRFALSVLVFELLMGAPPTEPRPCPAAVGFDPDDASAGRCTRGTCGTRTLSRRATT